MSTAPPQTTLTLSSPPSQLREGLSRRDEDAFLRAAFRHHSRTFSLATWLLPRRERLPVATLYMYCRTVDTLADEDLLEIGADAARSEVERLREHLDATLDGNPPTDGPETFLWSRLGEAHERYGLHAEAMHQLLDGAQWDIEGRPIRSSADLLDYSNLVAGSVGAMMLPFLVRDRADVARLDQPARALGCAMQLTNILRDVGEDWRDLQRVYLPADSLSAAGIDIAGLSAGDAHWARYVELVEGLMTHAESLYDKADAGIQDLRQASQFGIRSATRMYREILNGVRANGYDNLTQRAFVPLRRKLWLIGNGDSYSARRTRLRDA